jgi:oxygen-independent coproporphyrinogen-3 oxidase
MAVIYFHIPFCKKRCYYCDFYTSINLKNKDKLITCLAKELNLRPNYLPDKSIDTIYFGGGTPSFLSSEEIRYLIEAVSKHYMIVKDAEITLEANPDDITPEYLKNLVFTGINRLSLGVQSIFDEDLKFLNRRHSASQGISAIEMAYYYGFKNISIDLIYGLPTLTNSKWLECTKTILDLPIKHLSAYHLTYEPGTVLYNWLKKGKIKEINEDESCNQYEILCQITQEKNFIQYEISNFGLMGYFSKHNCSYWNGTHYLGIGPSAHSYNGERRQWNVSNNQQYIEALDNNKLNFNIEKLNEKDKHNDFIITSLRAMWGLNLNELENKFGYNSRLRIEKKAINYINSNLAKYQESNIILTKKGMFLSDSIISDFLII